MNKPTVDEVRRVLSYNAETGKFGRLKKWGSKDVGTEPGCLSKYGYWQIGVLGKTYTAQQLAWLLHYGEWPNNVVDHINRNKLDNRIENLRCVHRSYNAHNTGIPAHNTSGIVGVRRTSKSRNPLYKPRWEAYIAVEGVRYQLGHFDTMEKAVAARKSAEERFDARRSNAN